MSKMTYTIETLRAGQPRPYADSEYEYRITVSRELDYGAHKGQMKPWLLLGDVETQIRKDEAMRRRPRLMSGGVILPRTATQTAKGLGQNHPGSALARNFREPKG